MASLHPPSTNNCLFPPWCHILVTIILLWKVGRHSGDLYKGETGHLAYSPALHLHTLFPRINLLAPELFFLILAHSVYKMWIIQEPNNLELWNKLHFKRKKLRIYTVFKIFGTYTGCNRRNVRDFGRVFLRSNYTDITQNTYIQSWTVTEIMAIEMCGLLGCRRTVRRPWCHTCPMRLPGNETW